MKTESRDPIERLPSGLVVLAGAGVSATPPCNLPSWMHFNAEVLDAVRDKACTRFPLNESQKRQIGALNVVDIGVALFSQVVHDAFAGPSWFEVLDVLDGTVPGPTHDALAQLAGVGALRAIVTTNFDTLFERSFADLGMAHSVSVRGATWDTSPLLLPTDPLSIPRLAGHLH